MQKSATHCFIWGLALVTLCSEWILLVTAMSLLHILVVRQEPDYPSRDGDSTLALESLFQCLTTLPVKKFFLISSLKNVWCNLRPFPSGGDLRVVVSWSNFSQALTEPKNEIVGITLKLNTGLHSKTCVFAETKAFPSLAHLHSHTFLEWVRSPLSTPSGPPGWGWGRAPLGKLGNTGGNRWVVSVTSHPHKSRIKHHRKWNYSEKSEKTL